MRMLVNKVLINFTYISNNIEQLRMVLIDVVIVLGKYEKIVFPHINQTSKIPYSI